MSKYTFELRRLFDFYSRETVEGWFKNYELSDYLTQNEIDVINERGTWSKDKLATKIVDHYYMREIGFETPYLFKHYVEITMKEIMEKKLPLIYSASIEYDPLVNVDYTETFERTIDNTVNGSSSDSNTTNSSGLTVNSDTPQGQISKTTILEGKYASNTQAGENSSTTTSSNENEQTGNTEEGSTKRVKGNSGVSATAQKMVQQYRENIIAIDTDIINELNDLFMGLW